MIEILSFVVVGVFTGLIAGMLGVGGGIISVPAMIMLLPIFGVTESVVLHMAIATSLLLIIPTSLLSTYTHYRQNAIHWPSVFHLTPGLVLGSSVGIFVVLSVDRSFLQLSFAVFLMLIAIKMLLGNQKNVGVLQKKYFTIPAIVIGGISSMLGVGGGTMIVPFLMWTGLSIKNAVASSSACGISIAITGSLLIWMVPNDFSIPTQNTLVYLPAFLGIFIGVAIFTPIGAQLTHKLNTKILRYCFIGILFLVSFKLIFS